MDKKTGEKSKTRPRFVKQDQVCIARLRAAGVICLETFKDFPQMGRFTLRDEGVELISVAFVYKCFLTVFGWLCSPGLFFVMLDLLPSARTSFRKDYRHRQSAEAGAREGLSAANGGMHEVLQLVPGGVTLPEPTPTAAFSLKNNNNCCRGER